MAKRTDLPPDTLVFLNGGYYEDRALRTGAIVEVQVYPPGAIIPLNEAIARGIDDYRVHVPEPLIVDDMFSGPGAPVRDPWPAAD